MGMLTFFDEFVNILWSMTPHSRLYVYLTTQKWTMLGTVDCCIATVLADDLCTTDELVGTNKTFRTKSPKCQ